MNSESDEPSNESLHVISVRKANAQDIKPIVRLFEIAIEEMESHRGGKQLINDLSGFAGINLLVHAGRWKVVTEAIAQPTPTFWLAQQDGIPCGFSWGRVAQHCDFGPLLGVVDFLYVVSDARRQRVGEALIDEMKSYFKSQGCNAMDANALPGDRFSKGFFEEAGFKARLLVMNTSI